MFFQVFKSGYLSSCWNFSIPLGFFFFLEKERLHDVRMKEKKTKKKWMKERMNDLVAEWISEWIDYYLQVLQQSELNWTRALYIIIYEKKKNKNKNIQVWYHLCTDANCIWMIHVSLWHDTKLFFSNSYKSYTGRTIIFIHVSKRRWYFSIISLTVSLTQVIDISLNIQIIVA